MDPVTGAVVIAGLKYAGPPAAAVVTNFLNRVLSPAGNAIGDALEHPIREWQRRRVARGQSVITKAAGALEAAGIEPNPVPARTLMPLLEKASLEEEPTLCERWVSLLASAAASEDSVPPSFVSILSELTPVEAALLEWTYRNSRKKHRWSEDVYFGSADADVGGLAVGADGLRLPVYIGNLNRLGLIRHPIVVDGYGVEAIIENREGAARGYSRAGRQDLDGGEDEGKLVMTDLGRAFVVACNPGIADAPVTSRDER